MLLFYKKRLKYEKGISKKAYNLSDAFVLSVANASNALINICAFVILFSGISEVIPLSESSKKILAEKKKGRKSFNYCVDLCPRESYLILCEECGEKYAIRISKDQKLVELLSNGSVK